MRISMTTKQLAQAVELAVDSNLSLQSEWDQLHIFDGFGLFNFKQVTVTLKQLAALVRWQCLYLPGGIDAEALDEIAKAGKTKFMVLD